MRVGDAEEVVPFVRPETTVGQAIFYMRERYFRHLLVMDGNELLGVLDATHLLYAATEPEKPVTEVMRRGVPVVDESTDVRTALKIMVRRGLPLLPLSRDGKLVGAVTEADILHLLDETLALQKSSGLVEETEAMLVSPVMQRLFHSLAQAGI